MSDHIVSLIISQKLKWEADLRAKVEALHWFGIHDVGIVVMRDDVLALLEDPAGCLEDE